MATSDAGEILSPYANFPTVTPQRAAPPLSGAGPPRIHRPTLLHHLLPRRAPRPQASTSNTPSADPSLSRGDDADGARPPVSGSNRPSSASRPQSQSQTQPQAADPPASQSRSPLPLVVMPDSTQLGATTRLLMEKLSARMDTLGSNVEQSLREIEMCRSATEGASEKCIKEVVDVVYKCQSNFIKKLEANNDVAQRQGDAIERLRTGYDMLAKVYESHTLICATQATAMQELQKQQLQLIQGLAPLEPLLKSISPQIENVVLALGTKLGDELQRSRSAAERQSANFEESKATASAGQTRIGKLEDKLDDILALLRHLPAAVPSINDTQRTPVQDVRKRRVADSSLPSSPPKRQRIYTGEIFRQQVPDSSDALPSENEGDPSNFSSTISNLLDSSEQSETSRVLRNKSRVSGRRRATIAPALPVADSGRVDDFSNSEGSPKHLLQREVDDLGKSFFVQSKAVANEAISDWSVRPKRACTNLSASSNANSSLLLDAEVPLQPKPKTASTKKRRESPVRHGKENNSHTSSINNGGSGSHKKKTDSKKSRRSTNVPNVSVNLRSPIPSPFVPPPPPQTQTQTDLSQTSTLVSSVSSKITPGTTAHIPITSVNPVSAVREGSFLLTLDSSQATSQTFTQVVSQVQTKAGTVGCDTPVVGGSEAESRSMTSNPHLSASVADASGKLAKLEDMVAAALFPEAFEMSAKHPMFDSYGRPKRYLSLLPGDDDDTVIDLLDDMLEG